mmetsp:Transcript_12335/g.20431  ORF Transcript_12335/g.20431 Transcript_12335/m.20431 type:complete len:245 (-) Transcript_12335:1677-2411(-)
MMVLPCLPPAGLSPLLEIVLQPKEHWYEERDVLLHHCAFLGLADCADIRIRHDHPDLLYVHLFLLVDHCLFLVRHLDSRLRQPCIEDNAEQHLDNKVLHWVLALEAEEAFHTSDMDFDQEQQVFADQPSVVGTPYEELRVLADALAFLLRNGTEKHSVGTEREHLDVEVGVVVAAAVVADAEFDSPTRLFAAVHFHPLVQLHLHAAAGVVDACADAAANAEVADQVAAPFQGNLWGTASQNVDS